MREGSRSGPVSIGIDIGGTFTDVVAATNDGHVHAKVPSTRPDPSRAVTAALEAIIAAGHFDPASVEALAHGTTVATNAMIERTLAEVGLITTRGFRDVLAIGRQTRATLYDFAFAPRWVPVARARRCEVDERMDPQGRTLIAPQRDEVLAQAEALVADGVEAIAIAFLHAYANADHEEQVATWIRQVFPGIGVWTSARAVNEFREYERTCTVVLDAALGATMREYLQRFAEGARVVGIDVEPTLMRSSGGVATMSDATAHPTWTLLSGPAAGVAGAISTARRVGRGDLLTVDVGGTSADMALIRNGEPEVVPMREVEGLPVLGTTLNIQAIGAGGGSVAWLDPGGRLRVGPRSAGAVPGPAAYGRGGDEPTVTDAMVVAGMLPDDVTLGGSLTIDPQAATQAITRTIAEPLGLTTIVAAHAILDVVNTGMALAARRVTVARGADPRHLTLVAYGGAGPMHAPALARELAIAEVLVPAHPGTLCALGLLVSDMSTELVRSCFAAAIADEVPTFDAALSGLAAEAKHWHAAAGASAPLRMDRFMDLRYRGQEHALRVPVADGRLDAGLVEATVADFHALHQQVNGFAAIDEPVEAVNVRLVASIPVGRAPSTADLRPAQVTEAPSEQNSSAPAEESGCVEVWWDSAQASTTAVLAWADIEPGRHLTGPAIVLQSDATCVVPPGWQASMQADQAAMLLTVQR